ncbi:helix-turn-helix domain-containing protein [Longimicrobium sp.]|uniref:helix-turn-helix domain-containing protein n=1 Tax=Longimicrobium sp. TaxID=2029185 RepID=UPI002E3569A2|nr:helix-turn-helix domain-containing protein [Longimicrobium sp.]HEX6038389.1 helix-turn-helix domain-containing protein [Longimicrobium sp.]
MTTLHEHLGQLVRYAPPGTLVPVDSLAELLRVYTDEPKRPAPAGLSLGEVAELFARVVDGQRKVPQEGTVRKWIRTGLRGVKLKAYRAGRHLRVLESDFESFVRALSEARAAPKEKRDPVVDRPAGAAQPETELEAYLTHYRHGARPRARPRVPGGASAHTARPGRRARS